MIETKDDSNRPADASVQDVRFPHAPPDWTPDIALKQAKEEGLELADDHWAAVAALHEYFVRHEDSPINLRELHDALGEKFHRKGGVRYLYQLFPGGPVAQGCRVAGLKAPAGAIDLGFGSVV